MSQIGSNRTLARTGETWLHNRWTSHKWMSCNGKWATSVLAVCHPWRICQCCRRKKQHSFWHHRGDSGTPIRCAIIPASEAMAVILMRMNLPSELTETQGDSVGHHLFYRKKPCMQTAKWNKGKKKMKCLQAFWRGDRWSAELCTTGTETQHDKNSW